MTTKQNADIFMFLIYKRIPTFWISNLNTLRVKLINIHSDNFHFHYDRTIINITYRSRVLFTLRDRQIHLSYVEAALLSYVFMSIRIYHKILLLNVLMFAAFALAIYITSNAEHSVVLPSLSYGILLYVKAKGYWEIWQCFLVRQLYILIGFYCLCLWLHIHCISSLIHHKQNFTVNVFYAFDSELEYIVEDNYIKDLLSLYCL